MKKIIGLILTLTMLLSLLTSCMPTVSSAIEKADKALREEPYKLEMKLSVETGETMIDDIFAGMNNLASVYIHGNNFEMNMDMGEAEMSMLLINDTFYTNISAGGVTYKQKAILSTDEMKDVKENYSAEAPFSEEDFEDVTIDKNDDGEIVIVCKSPKAETINAAIDEYLASFEEMDFDVSIDDISYIITFDDSRYDEMEAEIKFSMSFLGEKISATMKFELDFDYDDGKILNPPADADSYETVDYSDILG